MNEETAEDLTQGIEWLPHYEDWNKDLDSLKDTPPVEWGSFIPFTAAHYMIMVKRAWRLVYELNFPYLNKINEYKRKRYEEYAQHGKVAVIRHFEVFDVVGGCGYKRAHDYSFQCWWDKFELEYLIKDLEIDLSKETDERKRNLDDVLEGYNGLDNMRKQEPRGEEEER